MSKRFFHSPEPIEIPYSMPLIFLEGPVQGAPDWQEEFAEALIARNDNVAVATPRPLQEHEDALRSSNEEIAEQASDRQVAYEYYARMRTFQFGAYALWWAAQDPTIPYKEGRVYGKTTNVEIGELWGIHLLHPDFPMVIGYDPEFKPSGANSKNYILRNHALMGIPTHDSLKSMEGAMDELLQGPNVDFRPVPASAAQSALRALDLLRSEPQYKY